MIPGGRWLAIYRLMVVGAFAAVLGWLLRHSPPPGWEFVVFFALALVAESMPVELPRYRGTISVSFVVLYAAVLILGPGLGMIVAALGTLCRHELERRGRDIWRLLFNRAQLGLAAAGSGVVFGLLGGVFSSIDVGRDLFPLIMGGLAYVFINFTLVALFVALDQGLPISHVWTVNLRWSVPHSLALLPVAFLLAAVYQSVGVLGMMFFLFPLLVGRYSYTMYSEMRSMFLSTISALAAALEAKDPYTQGHAERVSRLAVKLARELDLPESEVELMSYVGTLHDIGKIGVHDAILKKPGVYRREEFEEMKVHPDVGARIIKDIKALGTGASWVRHHHEHYDGSGYPDGLSGESIPLGARIISVADAFDAMVSGRPYRPARTPEDAARELVRCAGTQFDPEIVERMVALSRDPDVMIETFGRNYWTLPEAAQEAAADSESDRTLKT